MSPRSSGEPLPIVVSHALTNDDFARAYEVPSIPFTARTDSTAATRESGEPDGCAPIHGGGTVWYRFQPTADLALTANTFGSDHLTALAVFTGPRVGELQAVGCDSDARGNAQAVFSAKAGTTYRFQITAPLGGGRLVFNLERFGAIERVSVGWDGRQADGQSSIGTISTDGRYVAFMSNASNLDPRYEKPAVPCYSIFVGGVPAPCRQVYVRDRWTGTTMLVSLSSDGVPGNNESALPTMSADGRFVAFSSFADNLLGPGRDTNGDEDIFVHDRHTGRTTRVSVNSAGEEGENSRGNENFHQSISADGRYVAFNSTASNLVPGDTNDAWDVFVHDRSTRTTRRVSVSSSGEEQRAHYEGGNGEYSPSISPDGRYVVFASDAANLVPGDTNVCAGSTSTAVGPGSCPDVFVHDLVTRETTRVSVSSSEEQARDGRSILFTPGPHISFRGRYVVFGSYATNLIADGTDGSLQMYVRDLEAGTTSLVSATPSGKPGTASAGAGAFTLQETAAISADGRFVVFNSRATDLVPDDTNGVSDVFLRDLVRGTTTRISVSPAGEEGNDRSGYVSISSDGRFAAFTSLATNLVSPDTNGEADQFIFEAPRYR